MACPLQFRMFSDFEGSARGRGQADGGTKGSDFDSIVMLTGNTDLAASRVRATPGNINSHHQNRARLQAKAENFRLRQVGGPRGGVLRSRVYGSSESKAHSGAKRVSRANALLNQQATPEPTGITATHRSRPQNFTPAPGTPAVLRALFAAALPGCADAAVGPWRRGGSTGESLAERGFAAAQLKMREEEHRLALEAKQREIDLITSLVRVRDQQVREMQKLTGSKQVHQKLEDLRSEKAQVEQLLLAKEKQLAAVQAVDPQMADASALQLGAQAIQMFHDSLRMKQDASTLARENEELRGQVDDLQVQLQEAQGSITEKRREVKELAANLSSKMKRIIELEEQVERTHREGRAMAQAATSKLAKVQEEMGAWQHDCRTAQQVVQDLQEEIAERDRRFMKQQVISRRHETSAAELQQQVADLRSRLAQADAALRGMASSNTFKDRIIHDMTDQVHASETKLHAYQIEELLGSGLLAREREAPTAQSVGLRLLRDAEAAMRSPSPSGGTTPGSLISKVPGARIPQPLVPPGESALPSHSAQPASFSGPREPTATAGQRGPSSINLPTAAIETVLLAEAYRPHPEDPIDEKVAGFANQPKNSASKALFCRLGPGSYLFGTQRVSVRLSPRTGELEARAGGDWMSIEELVRAMQPSQSVHLLPAHRSGIGTGVSM
ncbi:SPECC1L [Symbiodinium sp. CCMP2592]|nr:SPECC1L [Symbiodinium sp. CCMP2592]